MDGTQHLDKAPTRPADRAAAPHEAGLSGVHTVSFDPGLFGLWSCISRGTQQVAAQPWPMVMGGCARPSCVPWPSGASSTSPFSTNCCTPLSPPAKPPVTPAAQRRQKVSEPSLRVTKMSQEVVYHDNGPCCSCTPAIARSPSDSKTVANSQHPSSMHIRESLYCNELGL